MSGGGGGSSGGGGDTQAQLDDLVARLGRKMDF